MGYTHYWTHKKQLTRSEWADFITGMNQLYEFAHEKGTSLKDWDGETGVPMATADFVQFNGDDTGEVSLGHESFRITRRRNPTDNWDFTKTAQKPYDLFVTAALAYLDSIHPEAYVVTSDGDPSEWRPGVELARMAWPSKGNQIDIPRDVRDEARYDRYLDIGKTYQVARDHEGVLWIERIKDRRRIRLSNDWYEAFMKDPPHSMRQYGSFRDGQQEACTKLRLKTIWDKNVTAGAKVEQPYLFRPLPV